ncbi:type I-C CRISPR-associated protein Cas8c/Csd1 [Legionella drancourtii]|uniref:Type I-C CRISPR-associated protein Cas8c/Csd1 n=1 Tax=Legionella drancourtii LLAP12 TaxID=658187 RepID=G9EUK4_9GAMM|nr:type I-C CRISPR-associated protein Cas8c/Csd1 [Legionella drancourtii]EHL29004.1 hypothetical protein LDG_9001 [Legionella drancourtii LLAP12]
MILQALKDYYDRKVADPDGGIAPEGFEYKEIPFVIVVDEQGDLVQIEDSREQDGKQLRAKAFLVPQAEKRASGVKANLLWDNAEYIFGLSLHSKPERVAQMHNDFVNRIKMLGVEHDIGVNAVLLFLSSGLLLSALEQSKYAAEIKEANPFMAFRLNGDNILVCERKEVVAKIKSVPIIGNQGVCLISGETEVLANLQPAIKGVRGANTMGGNLVSFNLDAFNSFGKTQGANAPIGAKSAFAYTTALNYLLRKDSLQKIQVGDASTVFWSEKKSHFEDDFSSLFDGSHKDDPDHLTNKVKALFKSVEMGVFPVEDNKNHFFVLGLSPNAARISVRFWQVATIAEFSQRIVRHFQDLELVHAPHQHDYLPLWELLRATALLGKSENIMPNLSGEWMSSILAGLPYPETLFQAVLRRIHAERTVSYPRAMILKGCLNRKARFKNQTQEEVTVALDKENKKPGYRLGRLFATLEKIQEEANPGINAPIRNRYYSSASSTPASVIPILMRLKNHHLAKLEKGRTIFFERLLGEILSEVNTFPSQLNLQDQGLFAIGYYHQRQAFFTKSEYSNQEE